jgi:hypothetical protein
MNAKDGLSAGMIDGVATIDQVIQGEFANMQQAQSVRAEYSRPQLTVLGQTGNLQAKTLEAEPETEIPDEPEAAPETAMDIVPDVPDALSEAPVDAPGPQTPPPAPDPDPITAIETAAGLVTEAGEIIEKEEPSDEMQALEAELKVLSME